MADKKPAAKPAPSASGEKQMIFIGLVAIMIFFVIIPSVRAFFGYGNTSIIPDNAGQQISYAFDSFVQSLSFLSIFISFAIILMIFYAKVQYKEITEAYKAKLKAQEELQNRPKVSQNSSPAAGTVIPGTGINLPGSDSTLPAQAGAPVQVEPDPRWRNIMSHMDSHVQSEWRVAILEADILLYDMLNQMGYQGDSIGEMLKQVDPSSFVTLQDAWKAHLVRNRIAHEGANYELTRDEAERVMRMYERVFQEFYFI